MSEPDTVGAGLTSRAPHSSPPLAEGAAGTVAAIRTGPPSVGEGPELGEPPDPYAGAVIGDRYRIIERIGAGGMGLVFRGEHTLMKKTIAIKLLHRELGELDDAAKRFEREAQSASRLSHASIVAVTDFGRAESGELFLIMEFVAGLPLASLIEKGRVPVTRAVSITRLILRGLQHAHGAGVVHRDLKPANIMVQPRVASAGSPAAPGAAPDTVKILDFGIAKMSAPSDPSEIGQPPESVAVLGGAPEELAALTRGGTIFGTPSYMAPEQATGETVDSRADLYACGVILYEMLTGRKPFVATDLVKVLAMQVTAAPPPFVQVAPDAAISPAIEAVVMKALRKSRGERFQSALEFLEALDQAERSLQIVERLRPAGRHAAGLARRAGAEGGNFLRWVNADPKRRRTSLGVAGAVLLFALGTSLIGGDPHRAAPPAPKPVAKALQAPLAQVEEKIARGQLAEAKVLLMQQVSKFPRSARVRFLLGTIAFAEGRPGDGLEQYGEALALDEGLRGDPALMMNVRSLLDSRALAQDALEFLIDKVGQPAAALLADIASSDKRAIWRARARLACEKLDCGDKVDQVASFSLDLQQAKSCTAKKAAVQGLRDTEDKRAIPVLQKAGRDRGGPLGKLLGLGNDCVSKDIAAALEELGAS